MEQRQLLQSCKAVLTTLIRTYLYIHVTTGSHDWTASYGFVQHETSSTTECGAVGRDLNDSQRPQAKFRQAGPQGLIPLPKAIRLSPWRSVRSACFDLGVSTLHLQTAGVLVLHSAFYCRSTAAQDKRIVFERSQL